MSSSRSGNGSGPTSSLGSGFKEMFEELRMKFIPSLDQRHPRGSVASPAPTFKPVPQLFALLIGINAYRNRRFRALNGAENDALEFSHYFMSRLGVPLDHITLLLGEYATRTNIMQAFKRLSEDPRIRPGDPIVIFYAGHGGEVHPQNGWEAGGSGSKIQVIIPHDASSEAGYEVPVIPDHTIAALLAIIAKAKGDNITVIFDCCHAASGTRGPGSNLGVRSVPLDSKMYNSQIDPLPSSNRSRGMQSHPQYQHGGLSCHTLLAACKSSEQAMESQGRGRFSSALLKLLWITPPDLLTYRDVLKKIDHIPGQTPQCEGFNIKRFLFSVKVESEIFGGFPFRISEGHNQSSPSHILEAGSIQGVTLNSQFLVPGGNVPLAVMSVNPFNSILSTPSSNSLPVQSGMATRIRFGAGEHLRLYVPLRDDFRQLFEKARKNTRYNTEFCLDNVVLVVDPNSAHLGARTLRNSVQFDILDQRATGYGFKRQFDPVPADEQSISGVLFRAGHFFRTLDRSGQKTGAGRKVEIEVYELGTSDLNEIGQLTLKSVGHNLFLNGVVDIKMRSTNPPYGFKIVNNSKYKFYAYLYYFSYSDLSITPLFQTSEAPDQFQSNFYLRGNGGTLTIGYGSGGATPFSFALLEHQNMEGSPFPHSTRGLVAYDGRKSELWDDILVPVILRR